MAINVKFRERQRAVQCSAADMASSLSVVQGDLKRVQEAFSASSGDLQPYLKELHKHVGELGKLAITMQEATAALKAFEAERDTPVDRAGTK